MDGMMSGPDFDIIVVGGGCAGSCAAYAAAKAGKSVLVVERSEQPGGKNMTGGRLYAHTLALLFSDYIDDAPLERKITHERLAFLAPTGAATALDFTSPNLQAPGCESYSVLRGPFDAWLNAKAEAAGAEFIYGIAVEALLKDDSGAVVGIRAGEDEITCSVVILCEGCNTLLGERYLGMTRPSPHAMAVGIKEVFELPAHVIEDRFLLPAGDGAAMLFVGDATKGRVGGGFLYTNKESISLGLVATIKGVQSPDNPTPIYQMLEDFKNHPAVAPVLRGAKVVEHSGHMVPEGGYNAIPTYTFDGCLVAGEAAGLCMNLGYQVRGMDFAIASGAMAAESAVAAIDAGDVSAAGLSSYKEAMENSFAVQDLRTFRQWPQTMDGWDSLFETYPTLMEEVMSALFVVDGKPQQPLKKRVMPPLKRFGLWKLFREARGALKAL